MSQPDQSPTLTFAPLRKTAYDSLQEVVNELAAGATVNFPEGFLNRKGDPGTSGKSVTINTTQVPVPNGARLVNLGKDCSKCIVNLVTTAGSPTIGILCLTGGGNNAFLTSTAPDSTYIIFVTEILAVG